MLGSLGFETTGVDTSESSIALTRSNGAQAHLGRAYDELAATYGTFPLVVSLAWSRARSLGRSYR
jgi:hypothetical protein